MTRPVLLAALLFIILAAPRPHADERIPSVKDVMRRVSAYVEAYGARAAIVVATERYTQKTDGNTAASHGERITVAEFAIVRLDGLRGWLGFRDVIDVDGRPVTDREDRLVRLLTTAGGGYAEARRLSDESARFNIGAIERNFNVPTTALFYFGSTNQDRFKFTAKGVEKDGTWQIAFRETAHPTLIRTPDGDSVPSAGEIRVNPSDGTIVRTLLKTDMMAVKSSKTQRAIGRVEVAYRLVEPLAMWLPETMTEMFEATRPTGVWERVEGRTAYSNYRQFTTSVRIK